MHRILYLVAILAVAAAAETGPSIGLAELEALLNTVDRIIVENDVPGCRKLELAAADQVRQRQATLMQAEQSWAEAVALRPGTAVEAAARLDAATLAAALAQIELRRLTVRRLQSEAFPQSVRASLDQARSKLREIFEVARLRFRTRQEAAALRQQTEQGRAAADRASRIDLPANPPQHTLLPPRAPAPFPAAIPPAWRPPSPIE